MYEFLAVQATYVELIMRCSASIAKSQGLKPDGWKRSSFSQR